MKITNIISLIDELFDDAPRGHEALYGDKVLDAKSTLKDLKTTISNMMREYHFEEGVSSEYECRFCHNWPANKHRDTAIVHKEDCFGIKLIGVK